MAAVCWLGWRVRRTRPENEPGQVDRHAGRSALRFELRAARPRGSLWMRGLPGEVCERLRGGMGQGDEPRSLRPRLRSEEAIDLPARNEPRVRLGLNRHYRRARCSRLMRAGWCAL